MARYKLSVTTPECDVIECGETIAESQEQARSVAWERYQHLVQAGHVTGYKQDRCNVEARRMLTDVEHNAEARRRYA